MKYPIKIHIAVLLLLVVSTTWAQTESQVRIIEAKDIPVGTSTESSTIDVVPSATTDHTTPSVNVQMDTIPSNTQAIEIIPTHTSVEVSTVAPTHEVIPVSNEVITVQHNSSSLIASLQDNSELAQIDKKWMNLVRKSDLYDTSSINMMDIPTTDIFVDNLTTDLLKQRLAEIDARTPFNVAYNIELERIIKTFLKTRQKAFANLLGKSKYYFPLFEEKLDKYDIPLEIKYLAIVESALRPKAKSRVGATGLWQFMYPTGKQYGLNVSSYIDERQDPILATEAACKYLEDLHHIFDDWDLALAAYNSGPGNVNKAIRRSGGNKNYWNIRPFLPRETASYVPLFYATLYLFEYAEEHNLVASDEFSLHNFEVDSVHVKRLISFEQIQKATGINEELLVFLNPAYKLDIIPYAKGKNFTLTLPKEYIGLFVQNEDAIYAYAKAEEAKREKPLPEYQEMKRRIRYRVRSGDFLGKIARKYGVSVGSIVRWNNLRSTKLRIGQRLYIHPRRLNTPKTNVAKSKPKKRVQKPLPKGKYVTYTVKEGDSLWSISQKYSNVSITQIKEWNNLWGSKLSIGTKLKIFKG